MGKYSLGDGCGNASASNYWSQIPRSIVKKAIEMIDRTTNWRNPCGDGHAGEPIVKILQNTRLAGEDWFSRDRGDAWYSLISSLHQNPVSSSPRRGQYRELKPDLVTTRILIHAERTLQSMHSPAM